MKATSTEAGQATGPIRRIQVVALLWIGLGAFAGLAGLDGMMTATGHSLATDYG